MARIQRDEKVGTLKSLSPQQIALPCVYIS